MKLAAHLKPTYCETFLQLLAANVDNTTLTDDAFRQFVENSLEIFQEGEVGVVPSGPSHDGRGPG